jgi:D-alanine transaminase
MSKIAYVDGVFIPQNHALVRMEDRGYQFGDGVYEVIYFKGSHLVDVIPHIERLYKSLESIKIHLGITTQSLILKIRELIRSNKYPEGFVYMQVTRGIATRDHIYPEGLSPVLTMSVKKLTYKHHSAMEVFTEPDIRWYRNDIKSISLLANVMAKNSASRKRGFEAWLIDKEGYITEASAANAWIVEKDKVITTPSSDRILNGITRERLFKIMEENKIKYETRKFTETEAHEASEAFLTSSTKMVVPVTKINGKKVGNGEVGPMTKKLQDLYLKFINSIK